MLEVTLETVGTRQRLSQSLQDNVAALEKLQRPLAVARALSEQLGDRVFHRGELAQPFPGYKKAGTSRVPVTTKKGTTYIAKRLNQGPDQQKKKGYKVSQWYAAATLGDHEAVYHNSSADFHAAAHVTPGTYFVTGGMARGMQSRNYGSDSALIEFDGSSLGGKSTRTALVKRERVVSESGKISYRKGAKPELSKDKDGNTRYRSKPVLIRNWIKAGTILRQQGINVLQHTPEESLQLVFALTQVTMRALQQATPGSQVVEVPSGVKGQYYQLLLRELAKST